MVSQNFNGIVLCFDHSSYLTKILFQKKSREPSWDTLTHNALFFYCLEHELRIVEVAIERCSIKSSSTI